MLTRLGLGLFLLLEHPKISLDGDMDSTGLGMCWSQTKALKYAGNNSPNRFGAMGVSVRLNLCLLQVMLLEMPKNVRGNLRCKILVLSEDNYSRKDFPVGNFGNGYVGEEKQNV